MNTENIYFATLSMVISRNSMAINKKSLPNKPIVVQKEGNYPVERYCDIDTGKTYKAFNKDMPVGTYFVDTITPFNYVTGNKSKYLSRKKVLSKHKGITTRN